MPAGRPPHSAIYAWGASLLGGLLLALPVLFPPLTHLVWLAPLPWLLLLSEPGVRRPALLLFAGACVYLGIDLHWLIRPGWALYVGTVVAYSLSFALFGWAYARCRRRLGLPSILLAPLLWTAMEGLRLVAYPLPTTWLDLGNVLVRTPVLAQIAEWTGVFGLSAVVLVVAGSVTDALLAVQRSPSAVLRRPTILAGLAVAGILVALLAIYGSLRLRSLDLAPGPRAALLQAAIPQDLKNDRSRIGEIFEIHEALTRSVSSERVDFIAWPETTLQVVLEGEAAWWDRVRDLARKANTPIFLGAFGVGRYPEGDAAPTNSVYLVTPDGHIAARWDKRVLVPPAETLPGLNRWPAARVRVGGFFHRSFHFYPFFVPGIRAMVRAPREGALPVGALVCYDDIVPGPSRELREAGAGVLLVLSNEAWFGRVEVPQHLDMARLRAIENRLPVLRATNTGATAFIDPGGGVGLLLATGRRGTLVGEALVTPLEPPPAWAPIAFLWAVLVSALLVVLLTWRKG